MEINTKTYQTPNGLGIEEGMNVTEAFALIA